MRERLVMRERLEELLYDVEDARIDTIADYLIRNGVIVPPCKAGDKTFLLLEKMKGGYDIVESYCVKILDLAHPKGCSKIYSMYFECPEIDNSLEFRLDDFGRSVFTSRAEAERELEGRKNEAD